MVFGCASSKSSAPTATGAEQKPTGAPSPLSGSPSLPTSPSSNPQALVDSLTNREIDILDLLAPRLSTKEIAEKLFISTTTVNTHLRYIYRKFKVSKRREAVEKAQALDIFKR